MIQVAFLHAHFQIFYVVTNKNRCNTLTYSIFHNPNVQMQTLIPFLYAPSGCLYCTTRGYTPMGILFMFAHYVYWKMEAYYNVTPGTLRNFP